LRQENDTFKTKIYDLEQKCELQESKIAEFNQTLEEYETDKYDLEEQNQDLMMQNQEFERDFNNAQSDHERDSALWDEKRQFLEKQKNQAKQDLADAQRKFEITIEQLQKKDNNERSKNESAQMLLISSIEKKYKDQISDLKDNQSVALRDQALK
jgi:chromosome segregation ATPase